VTYKTRLIFLNSFVRGRLTYSCQYWFTDSASYDKIDSCYRMVLRKMIREGFDRKTVEENDLQIQKGCWRFECFRLALFKNHR